MPWNLMLRGIAEKGSEIFYFNAQGALAWQVIKRTLEADGWNVTRGGFAGK